MDKQKIVDKKEDKIKRLCKWLAEHTGETISPTPLGEIIGKRDSHKTHKDTITDIADQFDTLKNAGFKTSRNTDGTISKIISSSESLDTRKELRNLRKEILETKKEIIGTKDLIDELKNMLKKRLQEKSFNN